MRSGLSPDFHDKVYTNKKANAPPIKANKGIKKNKEGKRATTNIDINPAPDDTPIIPGSASGFFTTACSNVPETDNMAPARSEERRVGKEGRYRSGPEDERDKG